MNLQLQRERLEALSDNSTDIQSEIQNRISVYFWTGTKRIGPEEVRNEFGEKVKLKDFINQRIHCKLNHSEIFDEIRERFAVFEKRIDL